MDKVLKKVSVSSLVPYDHNNKIHWSNVEHIAKSIDRNWYVSPIIIDENNVILAGHGRKLALDKMGIDTAEVIQVSWLTEQQKGDFRISDNKIAELSERDFGNIQLELKELDIPELSELFVDVKELQEKQEVKEDDYEIPDEIKTDIVLGDLFEIGEHRLLCGDSTDKDQVAKLMNGEKADMVFTDPPYGVSYADKNKYLNTISRWNSIQKEIANDHMNIEDISEFIYKAFSSIKEILAKRSSYYITAPQWWDLMMMMMQMQKAWIPLRHCLIWAKNNHVLWRTDYNYKHEPILYWRVDVHDFYGKGEHKFSVWNIDKPLKNDLHPTMKPIALIVNAIMNSTKLWGIVFDGFLWSGSTIVACHSTTRKGRWMELDPQYCQVIVDRMLKLDPTLIIKKNWQPYNPETKDYALYDI